jgi:hypothetical protein
MTPVLDKVDVDVTSPGAISERHVSSGVRLAGGTNWVNTFGGAVAAEAPESRAAVSEDSYRVASREIHFTLEHTETGGFITAEAVTGIFGFGRDLNESLRDLFTALYEHRDVLERQESLSPGLQEQLDYLKALL